MSRIVLRTRPTLAEPDAACLEPGRPAVDEPASGGCGGGGRRAQQTDRHACHALDRVRRIIDFSAGHHRGQEERRPVSDGSRENRSLA
jgi:hypothetical protein